MLVDINLLPERDNERSSIVILAMAVIVSAILCWLILFIAAGKNVDITNRLAEQSESLQVIQEDVTNRLITPKHDSEKSKLESTVVWAESHQFETVPLVRHLITLLPERGFFVMFTYTGPHFATIDIQFDESKEASFYLAELKNSSLINTATLTQVNFRELEQREDDVTEFLPRYIASYEISFQDSRDTVTGTSDDDDETDDPFGINDLQGGGSGD